MHKTLTALGCTAVTAIWLVASGCNNRDRGDDSYNERQNSPHYTQQSSAKPYPLTEEKGIKFAVLAKGAVVTQNINGWKALTPEFFTKMTGIAITAPAEDNTYHPGMGYVIPRIEASEKHPERKLTSISAGYLVPKEIHGWVAIDQATFDKVTTEWMTGGNSSGGKTTSETSPVQTTK